MLGSDCAVLYVEKLKAFEPVAKHVIDLVS
jgi:hypothetical protein